MISKMNLRKQRKGNKGITLIALVITIIVLLILAGISIASLTGENGILSKAETAKKQTEIEDAKEQAKLDIAAWIANKLQNGENADLNDNLVKEILTDKEYVKDQPGDTSFKTVKSGYDVPYSDLYQAAVKKVSFTITCPEGKEQYAGTFKVDAGTTWEEFFEKNNPEQYDDMRGQREGLVV